MTNNQEVARGLAAVVLAIAAVTAVTMVLAARHTAPVLSPDAAQAAAAIAKAPPLERLGAQVYERKGCNVCHTVDGTARIGPTFLGDYGQTIALADGELVTVDDAYIRESLRAPQAKARPGYPPTMPSFETALTPRETDALIAYLKSLSAH